ncbi:MAG: hypothetical protein RIK87_17355 [Fuerstiella sp.]
MSLAFSAVASLLLAGCGGAPRADYASLGLVDVTGTVKLDGTPLAATIIAFRDLESGGEAYGLTDEDGHYRLHFDSEEYGVTPGQKQVSISTTRKVLGLNSDSEGGEGGESTEEETNPLALTELVPEAYRGESVLKVTVSPSTTELNFDLASDGSTTGPE